MRNAVQLCLACVWRQMIFCTCVKETVLFSIALAWKWQMASLPEDIHKKNKLGDRMIKQLLNSVIAKYRDLSVSRRSIICISLRLRQIIGLLPTDKSRYFAQPRPIIVKYFAFLSVCNKFELLGYVQTAMMIWVLFLPFFLAWLLVTVSAFIGLFWSSCYFNLSSLQISESTRVYPC